MNEKRDVSLILHNTETKSGVVSLPSSRSHTSLFKDGIKVSRGKAGQVPNRLMLRSITHHIYVLK